MLINKFGLKDKLTLLIAGVILLVVGIFSFSYYTQTRALMMETTHKELKNTAASFSLSFSGKEIDQVLTGTETAEAYWRLKRKLNRLIQINEDELINAYIMVPTVKKDTWMFVADSELRNKSNMAYLREEYDVQALPDLTLALIGPTADRNFNADKWGRWLSGYAPIYDQSNRPQAVLGIDVRAGDIERLQQDVINTALIYLLAGSIFAVLIGWLGSQTLIAPITALSEGVKNVQANKYGTHIDIKRNDELGELIAVFNDMSDKIGEVDRIKADFLAVISHELYTPLTPIKEGIDQLKAIAEGMGDNVKRIVALIERQALKLQGLVDELLDFSWLDTKDLTLNKEPIAIGQTAAEALEEIKEAAGKKNIALETDFAADLPVIMADRNRIIHVFKILLDNAVKFSSQGSKVLVTLARAPRGIMFSVADSGLGIAPENLEKIFGRFYQDGDHLTRTHGGVGLGLAIARKIVEVHGGTIKAESAGLGQGSRFIVNLPIVEP
ncbi:MAG: HAMP domain-containing histidine kinase [Candidatus Saganbacteria bacterium]|nr:HAMP domain-containing histidine kinase [Candidatus Saganbacteria bacterium]